MRRPKWQVIGFYVARGEYGFLSNLYPCHLMLDGIVFNSSEHAYQFGKPKDPQVAHWLMQAPFPRLAAITAHHLSVYDIRSDWKDVKADRMREVVRAKFSQNPDLKDKLLATGDADLVEKSNDSYWGSGQFGNGMNMLGQILEQVRGELKK